MSTPPVEPTTTTTTLSQDPAEIALRLRGIGEAASFRYYEMSEAIRGVLLALVSGQNAVLLGTPGTAKSAVEKFIVSCIDGSTNYIAQFQTSMRASDIVGGRDPALLMQGIEKWKTTGTICEANIAVKDEIWKGPDGASNAMLSITHPDERLYTDQVQGKMIKSPLRTSLGSSNELPAGFGGRRKGAVDMAALWSRFVIRVVVEEITDHSLINRMWDEDDWGMGGVSNLPEAPRVHLEELEVLKRHSVGINFPVPMRATFLDAMDEARGKGVTGLDPRKKKYVRRILHASAALRGSSQVGLYDLRTVLPITLWNEPDQRTAVKQIVDALGNDADRFAAEAFQGLEDHARGMRAFIQVPDNLNIGMERAHEEIVSRVDPIKELTRAWDDMKTKPEDPDSYNAARASYDVTKNHLREEIALYLAAVQANSETEKINLDI